MRRRVMQHRSGLGYLLGIVALLMIAGEVLVVIPSLTPAFQWGKVYDGTPFVYGNSAQQTSDGGCILAGETAHWVNGSYAWLLKADSEGNVQWNRTFGGSGYYEARSVEQTSDGGYIFTGSINPIGAGNDTPLWLVKLDQEGNMQWNRSYTGVYAGVGHSLQQTSSGGYIVTGYGYWQINDTYFVWVAKTDANGNMQWNRTFGNMGYSFIRGPFIQQTLDNGYIVSGMTPFSGLDRGDALLIKLDQDGSMQWSRTYGGTNTDLAESVLQTPDAGYLFVGNTWSSGAGLDDVLLVKVDVNGTMQWNKTIGGPHNDEAYLAQMASDGGYILIGRSSFSSWLMKTDSHGVLTWKLMLRDVFESAYDVVFVDQTSDGGYMIAGYIWDDKRGGFWLMKLAESPSPTTVSVFLGWTITMTIAIVASLALIDVKRRDRELDAS